MSSWTTILTRTLKFFTTLIREEIPKEETRGGVGAVGPGSLQTTDSWVRVMLFTTQAHCFRLYQLYLEPLLFDLGFCESLYSLFGLVYKRRENSSWVCCTFKPVKFSPDHDLGNGFRQWYGTCPGGPGVRGSTLWWLQQVRETPKTEV